MNERINNKRIRRMEIKKCGMKTFKMRKEENNERRKEMFYLMTHSTHFIYGYMASDIIMVKETRCRHNIATLS